MSAMVQSYSQQSGTATMLQARPSSAGGILPPQGQASAPYATSQHSQTSHYNGNTIGSAPVLYRAATAPIQPYAFTLTPSLNPINGRQSQQQPQHGPAGSMRSSTTAPSLPRMHSFDSAMSLGRMSREPASISTTNYSTGNASAARYAGSRDDSILPGPRVRRTSATQRPHSAAYLTSPAPQLSLTQPSLTQTAPARPSPDRYRRPSANAVQQQKQTPQSQSSAINSGPVLTNTDHLYAANGGSNSSLPEQHKASFARAHIQTHDARPMSYHENSLTGLALDDISLHRQSSDDTKRFRRRSMPSLSASEYDIGLITKKLDESSQQQSVSRTPAKSKPQAFNNQRPALSHSKASSSESVVSSRSNSRPSSTNRNNTTITGFSANFASQSSNQRIDRAIEDIPKLVNIPPRVSSDVTSRLAGTSATNVGSKNSDAKRSVTTAVPAGSQSRDGASPGNNTKESVSRPVDGLPSHFDSPAMQHLSAINQKGGKLRSKTSKLRRAFSFGSAAELRKAAESLEETPDAVSLPNKLQKEPTSQELYDAEQARIVRQQEEGGIGSSIYGTKIFSGSTDNLSVSSTASSASIMIRKMGRGMKKSTRSLVGLFRPKSVVGVPAADAPIATAAASPSVEAAEAAVSMVTVEAERARVNVHPDVHGKTDGGTGFPRLERNSVDATRISLTSDRLGSSGTDNSAAPRKSIIEGDKERAEVLAAVRKGILKNTSGASSPSRSPADTRNLPLELSNRPAVTDSPASSAPSTPTDDIQGHKRSGSVAIGGEDYFISALRLRNDSRSESSTPQGSLKRNATFSPRIVFYDTWPSQEYDRRGEIATCNRLTPMLAQQIKEELNSFKMEMEVHENSKVYTHFF
ncbi:bud neck involved protein [Sporothrix epigloea]|uniref:Bud neck involved protein n=1 Tax=Sporothrix epigloea TaxID=1892477 RepID=A0ABP0DCR3_9PEZI